jgi:integrase/recombinase XerD
MPKDILETVTTGLTPQYHKYFKKISSDNGLALANYLNAMKTETNLSDNYRKSIIKIVSKFSRFCNDKRFKSMTRDDLISFLNSIRKPEQEDPMHRYIGTYNYYNTILTRFFKWLYNPDMSARTRPKPKVVENIPSLKRKEISIYKPTDLWTEENDQLFLKYCPSKRMKCYHTVSRDTSCRPHEILKLKIKDIVFKLSPDKTKQYAEVLVNGKTGSRNIPLINSIPYVKDYLTNEHPKPSNPDAAFICGLRKRQGMSISNGNLLGIYTDYKDNHFPRLLQTDIPQQDKDNIKELLKKPWNPYIRRHSGLTEKSLKIPGLMNQYAGWVEGSMMSQKYFHYFGNESSNGLLEAYGIVPKDNEQSDILKPKQCPQCNEPNKPDSKFCAKCRMVLQYDSYLEVLESENKKDLRIQSLEDQLKSLEESQKQSFEEFKQENRHIIAEAMAKYTAQLPKKALERFRKPIIEVLEEG